MLLISTKQKSDSEFLAFNVDPDMELYGGEEGGFEQVALCQLNQKTQDEKSLLEEQWLAVRI